MNKFNGVLNSLPWASENKYFKPQFGDFKSTAKSQRLMFANINLIIVTGGRPVYTKYTYSYYFYLFFCVCHSKFVNSIEFLRNLCIFDKLCIKILKGLLKRENFMHIAKFT